MAQLTTSFVGLTLQSPIIVGSSGLTRNIDHIRQYAEAGAGAVVVKSLFEEQVETHASILAEESDYPEAIDYLQAYMRDNQFGEHLALIQELSDQSPIPVIASINCYKADSWFDLAPRLQQAGAQALEVNIMRLETDLFCDPIGVEQEYCSLVKGICSRVSIPVIVKLSRYHTALPALVDKLRACGAKAVTLFNRSYQPDIKLESETMSSADVLTHVGDFPETLRFTALVSGLVPGIEVSSSTGIYGWEEVAKSLLAGAATTQMCSVIYREGASAIDRALEGLRGWMNRRGYGSVDEVMGRMNARQGDFATQLERIQFMKYFANR